MGKLFTERMLDSIAFNRNGISTLELPRNAVLRGLTLRLVGIYTTTGTAPTGKKSLTPYRLIKRIEVVLDGKDTIKSVPFYFLRLLNKLDSGLAPDLTDIGSTASTAYAFVACAVLPFAFTRARRPIDGGLNCRNYQKVDLRITWGSETDFHSTINSAAITACELQLKTLEYIQVDENTPFALNKHSVIEREILSTSSEFQERLAVDRIYRRFLLYTEADEVAVNTILNAFKLSSGTFVYKQVKNPIARSEMKSLLGLESLDDGATLIELTTDGMLSEALNSKGLASLEFVFDVTKVSGTNKIYIFPEEVQ